VAGVRERVRRPCVFCSGTGSVDFSTNIRRPHKVTQFSGLCRVFCGGQRAADHERSWAWHQVITDPEHKAAAAGCRSQNATVHNVLGGGGLRAGLGHALRGKRDAGRNLDRMLPSCCHAH
jgi:hypothetical protein